MTTFPRLAASVALGAAIAASVLAAPPARADSSDFLEVVHALGFYNVTGGDVALLAQGYGVCRGMDNGANGVMAANWFYNRTDGSVDYDEAVSFVVAAVENLCPWHDHRGQAA